MAKEGKMYFVSRDVNHTIKGYNVPILISFSLLDGSLLESFNPHELQLLSGTQVEKLSTRLRTLKRYEGMKLDVKASGQAVRNYQFMLLEEVMPQRETMADEALDKALNGLTDAALEAAVVEEASEEQPAVEEVVSNDDIDALIAAAAKSSLGDAAAGKAKAEAAADESITEEQPEQVVETEDE